MPSVELFFRPRKTHRDAVKRFASQVAPGGGLILVVASTLGIDVIAGRCAPGGSLTPGNTEIDFIPRR